MSERPNNHGYAAFDRDDIDDAKRGRPDFDTRAFAAERGLEYLDEPKTLAGWKQALARFPEYMHNQMRGPLPGGRNGVLFHESFEINSSGEGDNVRYDVPGGYHSVYFKGKGSATWLNLIPFIGWMFSKDRRDDDVPFGFNRIWVPCTVAAVHVPEVTGVAGSFLVHREERMAGDGLDLARVGLPRVEIRAEPSLPDDLVDALMGGQHAAFQHGWAGGYLEVRFGGGTLVVRRNGYLPPEELDRLATEINRLADHFAAVCAPRNDPQPFDTQLPAASFDPSNYLGPLPPGEWQTGAQAFAEQRGLVHEDPRAFHLAFPTLPHPGEAVAVMRDAEGRRVVYYAEQPVREKQNVRGALLFKTATPDTPAGGERVPDQRLVYEAKDGIALIWSLETWGWKWANEDTLVDRARAFADQRDL